MSVAAASVAALPQWFITISGVFAALLALLFLTRQRRRANEPPLIQGWLPFMGVAIQYGKEPRKFLSDCVRQFGSVFTLLLAGKRMTFLMDPAHPGVVFKGCRQLSFEAVANDISEKAFGHGHIAHETLEKVDSLWVPCLQGAALSPLTERLVDRLYNFFHIHGFFAPSTADPKLPKPISPDPLISATGTDKWFSAPLFQFVGEAIFFAATQVIYGDDFCSIDMEAYRQFVSFDNKFHLLVAGVPQQLLGNVEKHRAWLDTLMPRSRNHESELLKRRNGIFAASGVEPFVHRRFQTALLWASQANTIPAASWTLAYIISHPQAGKAILDELISVAKQQSPPVSLTDSNGRLQLESAFLRKLPLLDSAINESLRFCSSSMVIRRALSDFTLTLPMPTATDKEATQDFAIRKDDLVCLFPEVLHRDPEIYSNPDQFEFDRFVIPNPDATQDPAAPKHINRTFYKGDRELRYPLLPFGGGVSHCPGRFFAFNEIRVLVLQMLWHFECRLDPSTLPPANQIRAGIGILPPTHDVSFQFRPRYSPPSA